LTKWDAGKTKDEIDEKLALENLRQSKTRELSSFAVPLKSTNFLQALVLLSYKYLTRHSTISKIGIHVMIHTSL
jgi:hypothetical protein